MVPCLDIIKNLDGVGLDFPAYSSRYHNALNLQAALIEAVHIKPFESVFVSVGFSIAIPRGLIGQIVSAPSLAEQRVIVLDAPSLLQPAQHEPIRVLLYNASKHDFILHPKTTLALLFFTPSFQVTWKKENSKKISNEVMKKDEYKVIACPENPNEVQVKKELSKRPVNSIRNRFLPPK